LDGSIFGFDGASGFPMPKAAHDKDPTKAPEFQKVVQTFLRTPPQPHTPSG